MQLRPTFGTTPEGENSFWLPTLAFVLIGICLVSSAALVLNHFVGLQLPGCGADSQCAAAAASVWGNVAGWPVSFIGLSYFIGIAVASVSLRGEDVPRDYRYLVRLGAAVSMAYLVIMFVGSYYCIYCLVIHVANLLFWLVVECSAGSTGRSLHALVTVAAGMALVSSLLNAGLAEQERRADQRAERELEGYIKDVLSEPDSRSQYALSEGDTTSLISDPPDGRSTDGGALPESSQTSTPRKPFCKGNADAAIKLVVFSDYECEYCQWLHDDIEKLLINYDGLISITVRHYPLCADCNFSLDLTTHPNACRAAQAAEAAGILMGEEGFWSMHRWLFQRRGAFTSEELEDALTELGIDDHDKFRSVMNGEEVLSSILADVVEAQALKVNVTPTVLINGSKLRGVRAENAVARAVRAVLNQQRQQEEQQADSEVPKASPDARQQAIESAIVGGFPRELQLKSLAATIRVVNPTLRITGSGVIVAARSDSVYALTADHLVGAGNDIEIQTFSRSSYPEPEHIYKSVSVVARSAEADLAMLRLSGADLSPMPLAHPSVVEGLSTFPVITVGCDGEGAPTCEANQVNTKLRIKRPDAVGVTTVWRVQDPSEAGRSGGPLVDEAGLVVGIASGVSDGKGYFAHPAEIYRFLSQNGLQWAAQSDAAHGGRADLRRAEEQGK